jgi:hypothetical protein
VAVGAADVAALDFLNQRAQIAPTRRELGDRARFVMPMIKLQHKRIVLTTVNAP